MEERIRPTKSGLFAIELLIAIGVFIFCATVCVGILVKAELMSRSSASLNLAVSEARSVAECYKAAEGDLERAAGLCGVAPEQGKLEIRYDRSWERVPTGEDAAFRLTLTPEAAAEGCGAASLEVFDRLETEPLLSWSLAALEAAS